MKSKDKMTIAFDLDDVLCFRDPEAKGKVDKYKTCFPVTISAV